MQSRLPLLPSGPGGVRKSTVHGPWHSECGAKFPELQDNSDGSERDLVRISTRMGGALFRFAWSGPAPNVEIQSRLQYSSNNDKNPCSPLFKPRPHRICKAIEQSGGQAHLLGAG